MDSIQTHMNGESHTKKKHRSLTGESHTKKTAASFRCCRFSLFSVYYGITPIFQPYLKNPIMLDEVYQTYSLVPPYNNHLNAHQ